MRILKKIIIFLIVAILIVIFAIIFVFINENKEGLNTGDGQGTERDFEGKREICEIQGKQNYFIMDNCINIYFEYVKDKNDQALCGILLDDYFNQIYINKVDSFNYYPNQKFKIESIFSLTSTYVIPYYIKGTLYYQDNEEYKYFVIYYDTDYSTFAIRKIDEKEYNEFIKGNVYFKEKNIKKNNFNLMTKVYFSEDEIIKKYFYDCIENILYYPNLAYDSLDREYCQKRFGSFENFQKYVKDQEETLKKIDVSQMKSIKDFEKDEDYIKYLANVDRIKLSKYRVENMDSGKRYICVDEKENYYIFEVTSPMKYTLKLDTYTINSEKFIQTYNTGNEQIKMQLNIDKFIKMINSKDYLNAYNLLDEGFRNNYFNEEEKFEKFVKNNFYEYSSVEFNKFSFEGEILIYEITLVDKYSQNNQKKLNIIMKLLDNYDFVMSFGNV